jgi:hypothetical protein
MPRMATPRSQRAPVAPPELDPLESLKEAAPDNEDAVRATSSVLDDVAPAADTFLPPEPPPPPAPETVRPPAPVELTPEERAERAAYERREATQRRLSALQGDKKTKVLALLAALEDEMTGRIVEFLDELEGKTPPPTPPGDSPTTTKWRIERRKLVSMNGVMDYVSAGQVVHLDGHGREGVDSLRRQGVILTPLD